MAGQAGHDVRTVKTFSPVIPDLIGNLYSGLYESFRAVVLLKTAFSGVESLSFT